MPVTVRTNESRARQKSAASDMATRNQPSAPKRTRAIRVNVAASDASHRGKRDPRFALRRTQNSGSDRQRVAHARSILGTGSGRAKSHSRPVGKPPSRPVGRAIAAELSRSYRLCRTHRKIAFAAERTEAGPGSKQVAHRIGPIPPKGPRCDFASRYAGLRHL